MGHVWAISGPCYGYFYNILASIYLKMPQISTKESCMPNRRILFNFKFVGPYWDHVWAIIGPCFDYFYTSFASRCLKWLNSLLKSHACQIEEYSLVFNYWDHMRAIFRPYFGFFLNIFASRCLNWLKYSLKSNAWQLEVFALISNYWNQIWTMFDSY